MNVHVGNLAAAAQALSIEAGQSHLFVSAHLDDAILSCGALISHLAQIGSVTVATVFTADAPGPHTISARAFLRQCGAADASTLFAQRRGEDIEVLERVGVAHRHLGFTDALFRRREDSLAKISSLGGRIPEFCHNYPTHRLHISRGRISVRDRSTTELAVASVEALARQVQADVAYFPLAIGTHVDHVITRTIGDLYGSAKVFYADFPYVLHASADEDFLASRNLRTARWDIGIAEKSTLISGYASQVAGLFPDGRVPEISETYYRQ